jgi:hypothetical protein
MQQQQRRLAAEQIAGASPAGMRLRGEASGSGFHDFCAEFLAVSPRKATRGFLKRWGRGEG